MAGRMATRGLLVLALGVGALPPPSAAWAGEPQTHAATIENFAFMPARAEVAIGDTVVWTNRDLVPHTATADDGAWGTDTIKNSATGSFVATAPGTLAYHCRFHPEMTGVIVVVAKVR
jgi:plastocyanin